MSQQQNLSNCPPSSPRIEEQDLQVYFVCEGGADYSEAEMSALAEEAGYEPMEIENIGFPIQGEWWTPLRAKKDYEDE